MPILLPLLLQAATPAAAPWTPRAGGSAESGVTSLSAGALSREGNARLTVRCDNNGSDPVISVQFLSRKPLGATDDRPVSLTVDTAAPIVAKWEFPGNGSFTGDSALVTQLTVALATAGTIRVHLADLENSPIDATFDGPPAAGAAIRQVLAACSYTFGVVPAPPPPAPGSPPRP